MPWFDRVSGGSAEGRKVQQQLRLKRKRNVSAARRDLLGCRDRFSELALDDRTEVVRGSSFHIDATLDSLLTRFQSLLVTPKLAKSVGFVHQD